MGRIAKEVLGVLDGTSAALARKEEVHRLAAVNRYVEGVALRFAGECL